MTTIVAHIGARKTATTHAQTTLGLNEELFADQGVYFPRAGRHPIRPALVAYHNLEYELRGDVRFVPERGTWKELADEVRSEAPDIAFISCENFEHTVLGFDGADVLLDRLRLVADRIVIVLVMRDWLSYVNSLYCQSVKALKAMQPFETFVRNMIDNGATRFVERLGPFLDAPDVTFRLVDFAEVHDTDPVTPVLAAGEIEVPDSLVWPETSINPSLGAMGVEANLVLGRYLQGRYPDFDNRLAQRLRRRAGRVADRNGWNDPAYWGFDKDLARRTLAAVQPEVDALTTRVWGRPWTDWSSVDRPCQTASFRDLDPRQTTEVIDFVMRMSQEYEEMASGDS